MTKKFLLIAPKNRTVYNFRGDLIRLIQSKGYSVVVVGPNRDNMAQIDELNVKFIEVPMNKNGINPWADLRYTWRLYRTIKSEKPDISLGYTIKPTIYGSIAARLAGVKSVNAMITGVGYLFTSASCKARVLKSIARILYKIGLASAHHVIFQNDDDRNEFVENGLVKACKTHIVNGSGVNPAKFPRAPFPSQTTFFMLSRVMYSKGVMEYLEAAKLVKTKHPEVRFMLLGAFEDIQDSISEEAVRKTYISPGIIDYFGESPNVASFYALSSVYVLPSYREGTPRTVLEAMATGRPIITTDAPGCRQTVTDGVTGFIVPVKNVEALAQKMEWFILHPEAIETMGEASYKLCMEKFEVSQVNHSMTEIMGI